MFFLLVTFIGYAQENKNELSLGAGLSMPLITINSLSDNFASNGASFHVEYGRRFYLKSKSFFTVNIKYLALNNPYALTTQDVSALNLETTPELGTWTGSSDKFKLSSYMIGFGWGDYLSKSQKWIYSFKFYLGNASLTSPSQYFESSNGYFIESEKIKDNAFAYSVNTGIDYALTKNIALGFNVDYFKSSFYFENQKINFSGGGNTVADPYTADYKNLTVSGEVKVRF